MNNIQQSKQNATTTGRKNRKNKKKTNKSATAMTQIEQNQRPNELQDAKQIGEEHLVVARQINKDDDDLLTCAMKCM
jgi:hypothetical protein